MKNHKNGKNIVKLSKKNYELCVNEKRTYVNKLKFPTF